MEGSARTDRFAERRYPPSALRLEEAARQGRFPQSADLVSAAASLAGLAALAWLGERLVRQLTEILRRLLDAGDSASVPLAVSAGATRDAALNAAGLVALQAVAPAAVTVGLMTLIVFAVAGAAGLLQGHGRFVLASVRPDWGRLDLSAGLGRMFSRRAWVRLLGALAKIAAVTVLAGMAIRQALPEICQATGRPVGEVLSLASGLACGVGLRVLAALMALAACDYLYQRWEHRQELRMTRREFLDDLKRMEGDPSIRRRRRRLAASRSAGAVGRLARAEVVLAGAGGRAVALRRFPGGRACLVVARASGRAGQEILAEAKISRIPILDNEALAEVVFARCNVGTVAPRTAHLAVVEFLEARGGRRQGMVALDRS